MTTGTGPGRYRRRAPARAALWAVRALGTGLAAVVTAGACSSSAPVHRAATASIVAAPVTAVPDTTPTTSPWDAIPAYDQRSRLGRWELQSRFLVLAALGDQGLATVTRPGKPTTIVFRGDLSIPPALRQEGWDHVGDPDSWHGYVFDAYQGPSSLGEKLFEVTTPSGHTHGFVHPLVPGEMSNNSFVAVAPNGQWMVSGEWGETSRLLVFPTPIVNGAAPVQSTVVGLAATIGLDRPVRDVQGCVFDSSTEMICSSTDPGTDLWPTPDQLLQVNLTRPLDGTSVAAHVTWLGELPQLSSCVGPYEVEGIDYDAASRTLRVEVLPPGECGLSAAVYDYHRGPRPARSGTAANP